MLYTAGNQQMLRDIVVKYNSDKTWLGYSDLYQLLFKREWKRILEFGVLHGGSLRAWKEWFPGATIYGVDNNQEMDVNSKIFPGEGFKIFYGDVRDDAFMTKVRAELAELNLISEDSRHGPDGQRNIVKFFKNSIAKGGLLVIEDLPVDQTMDAWLGPDFDPSPLSAHAPYKFHATQLLVLENKC